MSKKEPLLLLIETATPVCSVALARGNTILGVEESPVERSHSSLITPYIEKLTNDHNLTLNQLDAISLSEGPGSYTGLRIGAGVAKGLCYALDIPLITVSTLQAMAYGGVSTVEADHYIPMIDARRMDVYTGVFNRDMDILLHPQPLELEADTFSAFLENGTCLFFGTGAAKYLEAFPHPNARGVAGFSNSAVNLLIPSISKFHHSEFSDTSYFEPNYLKNFLYTSR